MSDVKFCIFKPLSLSCCNNWFVILIRMSIFLLIQWNVHFYVNTMECPFTCYIKQCYCLPHEKQNTKGNYSYSKWFSVAFRSIFGCCLSVCQLSQMKTNQSIIPSPIAKPIKTFLDWVTTFHFARFV